MTLVLLVLLILKYVTKSLHGFGTMLISSSLASVAQQRRSKPRQEATKARRCVGNFRQYEGCNLETRLFPTMFI
jgi:hypothetical protein